MAELEQRCWALAGERMASEPLASVLALAGPIAARLLRLFVDDPAEPVASFFSAEAGDVRGVLAPEGWATVAEVFLRWAGHEPERADDWVAAIDGLDEAPPLGARALAPWLMKHGVRRRLADPLRNAEALGADPRTRFELHHAGARTIEDALEGRLSVRGPEAVRDAARSYLSWAAGRLRLRRAREEIWSREPEARGLRAAAARVKELLRELDRVDAPAAVVARTDAVFAPSEDGFALELTIRRPQSWLGTVTVQVHLLEAVEGRAASYSSDHRPDPGLLRLCAERAMDALTDPDDPLHATLRDVLERPRWAHLLAELEREVTPWVPPRAFGEDERLIWRVGERDGEVFVEAALQKRGRRGWTRGRQVELSRLEAVADRLDPRDLAALRGLAGRWGQTAEHLGAGLLGLVGHPRVVRADKAAVPVRVRRGGLEVRFEEVRGELHLAFRAADRAFTPAELVAAQVDEEHVAFFEPSGDVVSVVPVPEPVWVLAGTWMRWSAGLPPVPDAALLALLARHPAAGGREHPRRLRGVGIAPDPRFTLRLEPLPGGGLAASLVARPLPGGPVQPPGEGSIHLLGVVDGRRAHVTRDLGAERERAVRLEVALGLEDGVPLGPHAWRIDEAEDALDLVAAIQRHEDELVAEWPQDLAPWRVVGRASSAHLKVTGKQVGDWLALGGDVELDEGRVALARILAALRQGRRYVALGKGKFAAIEDELRARLEPTADLLFERDGEIAASIVSLPAIEAALPAELLSVDASWRGARDRIAAAAALPVNVPSVLDAQLRDYQRDAVAWLLRLASWAPGACLADDMGLGKTVQALALIAERAASGPALVVAPTSLAETWRRESERFTPSLRTVIYRGPNRPALLAQLEPGTILVTSYDILLRDVDALGAVAWSTRVFDEAHALKNPDAQRSKAARALTGGFALALTGTPLENHLGELYSLFATVVPGLLGPWPHFRARFAVPIERDGDLERRARLRGVLRPFLLRRTKAQVAPELPPRVEVVRPVELSVEERALYEAERREALERLAAEDPAGQRFAVLAALTRMRRLACHPALVHPDSRVASSKLAEALALADDLRAEGHRALVFSQFTSHLKIVRAALEERGYRLLYLDGATPAAQRGPLVDAWQRGEGDFFLISLKAGGTGLHLTAADTVIHLDPWWNPAAEDQASDRTHRIGQDKPVTVVRLVSQDTIEETVLSLHETKRELARGILEGAETNAKLSTEELLALLSS